MKHFKGLLQVNEILTVARETVKIVFSLYEGSDNTTGHSVDFSFEAGQFLSLQFGENSWRAYSIASPPDKKHIELVVRLIPGGVASTTIKHTHIGDIFPFKGPFGHFILSDTTDAHLVFCATGTGIAPIRSQILSESKKKHPRPMTLLYGGRNKDDIAYLDEIQSWAPHLQIQLGFSRETNPNKRGPLGHHCRITHFVHTLPLTGNEEFYICGNGDMVQEVQGLLETRGVKKSALFCERFN